MSVCLSLYLFMDTKLAPPKNYSGANDVISMFVKVHSSVVEYCGLSSVEAACCGLSSVETAYCAL